MAILKIEIKNAEEVKKFLRDKNKEAIQKVSQAVDQSTLFLESQIKQSISQGANAPRAFKTGNFMRNTTSQSAGLIGKVINRTEYGPEIEYGTSKMEARPHFRNTTFVESDKIKRFIQTKIKEI